MNASHIYALVFDLKLSLHLFTPWWIFLTSHFLWKESKRGKGEQGEEKRGWGTKCQLQLPIIIIIIKQSLNRKSNYSGGNSRTEDGPLGLY